MVNPEQLIGKVIDGRYCLARYIGGGAFGHVFEARERFLDEDVSRVAVKLIYPGSEAELNAVRREIQGLARLSHDHVIAYHACGPKDDGLSAFVYVVTELADTSLNEVMRTTNPVPEGELRVIARGIAAALAHIHARSAVHRDVKPENILRAQGRWKLGDFGLTRPVQGTLVQGSCFAGTPVYMPPEALRGEIGPPTDVYALGVTLWECLSGRRAGDGSAFSEYIDDLPRKPANSARQLRAPWDVIIPGCLKLDPRERWTAAAILECLAAPDAPAVRGTSPSSPPWQGTQCPEAAYPVGPMPAEHPSSLRLAIRRSESKDTGKSPDRGLGWKAAVLFSLVGMLCLGLGIVFRMERAAGRSSRAEIPPHAPAAMAAWAAAERQDRVLPAAEQAWRAGDYAEAERRAKEVVRTDRFNVAALKLLGAAALVRHAPGEGAQRYRAALRADPSDGEAWLGYATCLETQHQTGSARYAYRQALRLAGAGEGVRREAAAGARRTRWSKG